MLLTSADFSIPAGAEELEVVSEETSGELLNGTEEQQTIKVYETDRYRVTFEIFASWDNGSNAGIKIENIGDRLIENWSLEMDYADEISNIWNATIQGSENGRYIIRNNIWNQDIEVGDTISFGISSSQAFSTFPESIVVREVNDAVKTDGVFVEYHVDREWDSGFSGSIIITNTSEQDLEDWSLELTCTSTNISFWNAAVVENKDNHIILHNMGYNSVIAPGTNVSVGFVVNDGSNTEKGITEIEFNLNYSRSNKEVSGYRFFDISKQNHPTHTGIALKMGIKSLSCS